MNLVLTAGALKNRKVILEYNKYVPIFADSFEMRHSYVKGGWIRLAQNQDNCMVYIKAEKTNLILEVQFKSEKPSNAFKGRMYCLLGSFMEHCKQRFGTELRVLDTSDIPDLPLVHKWGVWAYNQVFSKYPHVNPTKSK